ncbi:MAG: hypothetical protein LC624_08330 [Halobacteriales archaeon]|nr:hypothetical protein [Halobacteriales archaeon]
MERGAPGVLAYEGKQAVGWCAIAPRAEYPRLATARTLRPIDDAPVWSVTCFFITKEARGLSVALLEAAVRHAKRHGARIVEGYPCAPKEGMAAAFIYPGLVPMFERAGFAEVARPTAARRIMRRAL